MLYTLQQGVYARQDNPISMAHSLLLATPAPPLPPASSVSLYKPLPVQAMLIKPGSLPPGAAAEQHPSAAAASQSGPRGRNLSKAEPQPLLVQLAQVAGTGGRGNGAGTFAPP